MASRMSARTVEEKCDAAKREFMKKAERLKSDYKQKINTEKGMGAWRSFTDKLIFEYGKIMGRFGNRPLFSIKGGRLKPRYIVDRDEVWVMYKPALWDMGSKERVDGKLKNLMKAHQQLGDLQNELLADEQANLYLWHAATAGKNYLDDQNFKDCGGAGGFGFIQRLDMETDGPVVCAKTWRSYVALKMFMQEHVLGKGYMCLVHGKLENRVQFIKTKFAEVGSTGDAATSVMFKFDVDNDPLFDFSGQFHHSRMAETFVKPLAYYQRAEDRSDYTLVYCNILTGITHQIRITMQSLGHPLVADDRYLPKEIANSDLTWCPRNFLTEVRSDWFDVYGPYKDEARRKYTRISIENPLPRLFQSVLKTRLTLTEKLDSTADLMVGPQYWSIGDEELMKAHPKDAAFRRKVMRWGQRKGIHLDALERLLLLPKTDIQELLNTYLPPLDQDEESWVCPSCGAFNNASLQEKGVEAQCLGLHSHHTCDGLRYTPQQTAEKLPQGWRFWIEDPTIHFLFFVNKRWLNARREVVKQERPSWQQLPNEPRGTELGADMLAGLEAALVTEARKGNLSISEEDIPQLPGFEDLAMPLAEFPETSMVRRMRLPGSGTMSRWVYALKGEELIKHTESYNIRNVHLKVMKPLEMTTGRLPDKQVENSFQRRKREQEHEIEQKKVEEQQEVVEKARRMTDMLMQVKRQERRKAIAAIAAPPDAQANGKVAQGGGKPEFEDPSWTRKEARSNPGNFYFFHSITGDHSETQPPGYEAWKRIESKSSPGVFYFHNEITGETSEDEPPGLKEWVKQEATSSPGIFYYFNRRTGQNVVELPSEQVIPAAKAAPPDGLRNWQRQESKNTPGVFYYFDTVSGACEQEPPEVDLPWELVESVQKGQYYYYNRETRQNVPDPPPSARPSKKRARTGSGANGPPAKKAATAAAKTESVGDKPKNVWVQEPSQKYQGKFYWLNTETQAVSWTKPADA
mmetsp:Transcript_52320/g.124882  ORF Transcript_52320/g.124882 Transcript_52320/m.124882 type:complete len:972 (-) Transcript_52320:20-2935(-)